MSKTLERKAKEKENRKNEILKAAEKLMKVKGIHGLSVDDIAAETKLAKGTIYLYFKNKEEILGNLTVKSRTLLYDEFVKINEQNLPPIEKIKQIILSNYQFYKKNSLYYDLVSLYEANHSFSETEQMYESSKAISELVASIVGEAKKLKQLNPMLKPMEFTMVLWGTTVGILQMIKVRGKLIDKKMKISENQIVNTFIETLLEGIKHK